MIAKAVLLVCAQALIIQGISCQCIGAGYNGIIPDVYPRGPIGPYGGPWNAGVPYGAELPLVAPWGGSSLTIDYTAGYGPAALAASNGGGFVVRSVSPIAVTGVTMTSENVYEGRLSVSGAVPFLAAVALEGALPTIGAGSITYGCGNGNVAMLTEDLAAGANGYAGPYGYGPGIAGAEIGYGYGPLAFDEAIVGPGYGYRGCGRGPFY